MRLILPISLAVLSTTAVADPPRASTPCVEIARMSNANQLNAEMAIIAGAAASKFTPTEPGSEVLAMADFNADGRDDFLIQLQYGPEHFVRSDGNAVDIKRDESVNWDLDSLRETRVLGVIYRGKLPYMVFGVDYEPQFATVVKSGRQHVVCNFGKRGKDSSLSALSALESIELESEEAGLDVWTYAIRAPGTRRLEELRLHAAAMNDSSRDDGLLSQAHAANRRDVFSWLLEHGADPNEGRDEYGLLTHLLWEQDYEAAIAVIRKGATIRQYDAERIAERIDGKNAIVRRLAMQTVNTLQAIPEVILRGALHDPLLFDEILGTHLPVRPDSWEWRADVPIAMSPSAAEEFAKFPGALEKARRAYEKTVPPGSRHAAVNFGDEQQGWRFQLAGGEDNPVSHEELLLFATAFCVYFLPVDCGSEQSRVNGTRWATELGDTCPNPKLLEIMDVAACNTVMYYNVAAGPNSPKPMFVFPTGSNWGRDHSILDMYRAKHPGN
jgi:hypothetical protein